MKLHSEKIVFKTINITLLYALSLNIAVPGVNAMSRLLNPPLTSELNLTYPVAPVAAAEARAIEIPDEVYIPAPVAEEETMAPVTEQTHSVQAASLAAPGEGSGFSLNSSEEIVDPFSGDFTYSIPLMDVEGYPLELSYNSNVSMNTEASWVGLGWNLNVGSVSREMRGIPDEFNGSQSIDRTVYQKPDITTNGYKKGIYGSLGLSLDVDIFSVNAGLSAALLFGKYTNTYLGNGKTLDLSAGIGVGAGIKIYSFGLNAGANAGVNLNYDSKRGVNLGLGGGLSGGVSALGLSAGVFTYSANNFNSRVGLNTGSITRGWSFDAMVFGMTNSVTSTITYGSVTSIPRLELNTSGTAPSSIRDRYFNANIISIGTLKENYSSYHSDVANNYTIQQPAIGYFHSGKQVASSATSLPIMDFNRSNDTRFSDAMTNIPFSMQTFDVFYTSAMGMQGTFRAQRKDIGTYVDGDTKGLTLGMSTNDKKGFDLIPLTIRKETGIGIDVSATVSGEKEKQNGLNVFEFSTELNPVNGFDAAVYFKGVGEATRSDASQYNNLGGFSPSRPIVMATSEDILLSNAIVAKSGSSFVVPPSGQLVQGEPTVATYFRPLTVTELHNSPKVVDRSYVSYSNTLFYTPTTIARNLRAGNLLSKVEVISTDGYYYGYGIPAYSNEESQVAFMIGSQSLTPVVVPNADGTVQYNPGSDNSVNNMHGLSHYYDKTKVPAYAQSFLLTEMLSADYIDRTGNGPTLDDIGDYYKFNYSKIYDNYEWRFPVGQNKACYMEGTQGSELDDIATYTYGKKEIWYSHSVESKNLVAEFVLEDREDGYGVTENGSLNGQRLKCLKRIELYNRSERTGPGGASVKPLQIVEFLYSYELCPNYPSNDPGAGTGGTGKLTLTSVRIYSGKSIETGLSAYTFNYGTGAANPAFNYGAVDAWGNYKPNDPEKPNMRFPYAVQNETQANANSKAWKLINITNPEHGQLSIDYEADRYSYVQNKRAMKHMEVNSLTNVFELIAMKDNGSLDLAHTYNSFNVSTSQVSYSVGGLLNPGLQYWQKFGRAEPGFIPNNVIVFKLEEPIDGSTPNADAKVRDDYFKDGSSAMRELMLKMHVKVKNTENFKELVPVFCTISEDLSDPFNNLAPYEDNVSAIGVLPPAGGSGDYTYGYVVVDPVKVGNPILEFFMGGSDASGGLYKYAFSPMQRASNDLFLRSLTDIVYGNTAFTTSNNMLDFLAGARIDINKAMRWLGYAPGLLTTSFDADGDGSADASRLNSIRLYIPSNIKFGGNARVKSITYSDSWNAISGEYGSSYEWLYNYNLNGKAGTGVASYESRASRDESAFYMWDTYYDIRLQFPDLFNYTPTPVMELLYPTGMVGYSKTAVEFNGAFDRGYSISEFYTAYDYPTLTDKTNAGTTKASSIQKWKGITTNICGFSQGFSIETNDFHGKPKQTTVFKGDPVTGLGDILSRSTYHYHGLKDLVKVVGRDGMVSQEQVGVEFDIHADSRKIENETSSFYFGLERAWYLPSPFSVKHVTKHTSYNKTAFYSHALVKHANRSAILKDIVTEYMGSKSTSEILVLDKHSGGPVLSSETDEFNDAVYSMGYPAHWYYRELREVTGRVGASVAITLGAGAEISDPAVFELLTPGDVIKFPSGQQAWVAKAYPWPTAPTLFLIDATGNQFTAVGPGSYTVRIVSTNRGNILDVPMQMITTKKPPVVTVGAVLGISTAAILSASTLVLRDRLSALCGTTMEGNNNNVVATGKVNPYLYGIRGDLVADRQLVWQSERLHGVEAHGVRLDGAFTTYLPYYDLATTGKWYPLNHPDHPSYSSTLGVRTWRPTGELTEYDQYGKSIETKDPRGVYNSVLYGYNGNLNLMPVAEAVNAKQQEIAFDGFEDYDYYSNDPMNPFLAHFDFKGSLKGGIIELDKTVRHSGLTSMKLYSGKIAKLTRTITVACDPATGHVDPRCSCSVVDECDCIQPFSPTPGEYVVGGWIRQATALGGGIQIRILGPSSLVLYNNTFFPEGSQLDGWQRLEGVFTIPSNAVSIEVSIINNGASVIHADDIRIHPFLADMNTVVYDPTTLLRLATHDGYNYTTFYNYDENMELVRVRVETAEGIKTISESEMSTYKSF